VEEEEEEEVRGAVRSLAVRSDVQTKASGEDEILS